MILKHEIDAHHAITSLLSPPVSLLLSFVSK